MSKIPKWSDTLQILQRMILNLKVNLESARSFKSVSDHFGVKMSSLFEDCNIHKH